MVCGIDEVGRGALAGPLVAGAAIMSQKSLVIKKLRDSKKLSRTQRQKLIPEIYSAFVIEIETISVEEINKYGIGWANKMVFEKLINKIEMNKLIKVDKYIIDGNLKIEVEGLNEKVQSLVRADQQVNEVMAASIAAKVCRDGLMHELHKNYQVYGWNTNAGYGTRRHIEAISGQGMCAHHRKKFVETVLSKRRDYLPQRQRGVSPAR